MVSHNYGWRIGIMTDSTLDCVQENLYKVLKLYEMEWKLLSPFSLRVRTTVATWPVIRQALHTPSAHGASENCSKVERQNKEDIYSNTTSLLPANDRETGH